MKRVLISALLLISTSAIAGENIFSCQFTSGNQYLGGSTITYKINTNNQGQITSTYISLSLHAIAKGPQTNSQYSYRNTIMTNWDGTVPPDGVLTSFYGVVPGNIVTYKGTEIRGVSLDSLLLTASFNTISGRLDVITGFSDNLSPKYKSQGAFYQCYRAQSLLN